MWIHLYQLQYNITANIEYPYQFFFYISIFLCHIGPMELYYFLGCLIFFSFCNTYFKCVVERLNDKITLPTLEFLVFFLESFQKYEQLFQRSEATMHLLYNKQVDLYRYTLISFCKFEEIAKLKSDSALVKFEYKKRRIS